MNLIFLIVISIIRLLVIGVVLLGALYVLALIVEYIATFTGLYKIQIFCNSFRNKMLNSVKKLF